MTSFQGFKRYEADGWVAWVPDVPGAHTWAPDRDEHKLEHYLREAIAAMLDLEVAAVTVRVDTAPDDLPEEDDSGVIKGMNRLTQLRKLGHDIPEPDQSSV